MLGSRLVMTVLVFRRHKTIGTNKNHKIAAAGPLANSTGKNSRVYVQHIQ